MLGLDLDAWANWASILTFAGGLFVYGKYQCDQCDRKTRLENYLKQFSETQKPSRSVIHLMAKLKLTKAEILQASFKSNHIRCLVRKSKSGPLAKTLIFKYEK